MLEGLHGDPVPLFELRKPPVTKRDAQHVTDTGFLPEAGANPNGVVISPRERNSRLTPQILDDLVGPRTAIAGVARDDDLVDGQIAHGMNGPPNDLEGAAVTDERLDDGVDVFRASVDRRLEKKLAKELAVLRLKNRRSARHTRAASQNADELEQITNLSLPCRAPLLLEQPFSGKSLRSSSGVKLDFLTFSEQKGAEYFPRPPQPLFTASGILT
jgi:hypothetical protein